MAWAHTIRALGITNYPDLEPWLAHYEKVTRLGGVVIYAASGPNRGRQFSGLRFDAFFRLRITRSSRSSICCGVTDAATIRYPA